MNQRFIRCGHCGMPHEATEVVCPATGAALRVDRRRAEHPTKSPELPLQAPPGHPMSVLPESWLKPRSDTPHRAMLPPGRREPPPSPAPPQKSPRTALLGETIDGKYLVLRVLGRGGMGTVFEAEHLAIGRRVAIKVLHPSQARKRDVVLRFHQEARAAGAIGHPNICEVYDLGSLGDGSPYLVMERLVGETLAERISIDGGMPFDDAIDVLVQVLSGLTAAHGKGIVHRDIKPENVFLIQRSGSLPTCKLLDFGLSKVIGPLTGQPGEDLDLTRPGTVMGTPHYMAPEQARGDRDLDERVDLYACGVILYEALTGKRPFAAANHNALLLQILSASPPAARELRPAMPLGFDAVLERAMARDRDERYPSAADFRRDLQSLHGTSRPLVASIAGGAERRVTLDGGRAAPSERRADAAVRRPPREPSASSLDIPIVFCGDTPGASGQTPGPRADSYPNPPAGDLPDADEDPTQVEDAPFRWVRDGLPRDEEEGRDAARSPGKALPATSSDGKSPRR